MASRMGVEPIQPDGQSGVLPKHLRNMEQKERVELSSSELKSNILADRRLLHLVLYQGVAPQSPEYQSGVLTIGLIEYMVSTLGLEPRTFCV